jgi:deoxyribonuclease V
MTPYGPPLKFALDVHHEGTTATAVAVGFEEWNAAEATKTYVTKIDAVEKPPAGKAWLRDLPCLLQLLREHKLEPEAIVLDGFVHLDEQDTPGLGRHLFDALGGKVPVIGLAKSPGAFTAPQFEVFREEEAAPVIVTCAGIDLGAAKARVRSMHGRKRAPTLLKLVSRIARGKAD